MRCVPTRCVPTRCGHTWSLCNLPDPSATASAARLQAFLQCALAQGDLSRSCTKPAEDGRRALKIHLSLSGRIRSGSTLIYHYFEWEDFRRLGSDVPAHGTVLVHRCDFLDLIVVSIRHASNTISNNHCINLSKPNLYVGAIGRMVVCHLMQDNLVSD